MVLDDTATLQVLDSLVAMVFKHAFIRQAAVNATDIPFNGDLAKNVRHTLLQL